MPMSNPHNFNRGSSNKTLMYQNDLNKPCATIINRKVI